MEIKVEKNVPLPTNQTKKTKYPFGELKEVGDSFLACSESDVKKQASIASCANAWSGRNQRTWKFTVRSTHEGIRVWRIE